MSPFLSNYVLLHPILGKLEVQMRTKTVTPLENQDFRRVSIARISFHLKRFLTSDENHSEMHST